jgi:23S rRNA (cytidine1920-2'-O)/16S rRNA (cytidine1409-2'-O)-methyltransferase
VVAVDVGRGQLAWSLRQDPRVIVRERCNVRNLTTADTDGPVDMVVADLSFISLRLVAPALAGVAVPGADAVLLVKPQFEAGREQVGRGGVVSDPAVHQEVLSRVTEDLAAVGLTLVEVMESPLRGPAGNVEFLAHFRREESA